MSDDQRGDGDGVVVGAVLVSYYLTEEREPALTGSRYRVESVGKRVRTRAIAGEFAGRTLTFARGEVPNRFVRVAP